MIEEYQRVWAEIDLDAVRSNMDNMKANISPHTKMIGVIKTDMDMGRFPLQRNWKIWITSLALPQPRRRRLSL